MGTTIGVMLAVAIGLHCAPLGYGNLSRGLVEQYGDKPALAADLGMPSERAPLGKGPLTRMLVALEGAVRGPSGRAPSQAGGTNDMVNIHISCEGDIRPLRVIGQCAFFCANDIFVNMPVTDGPAPMILVEFEVLPRAEGLAVTQPGRT